MNKGTVTYFIGSKCNNKCQMCNISNSSGFIEEKNTEVIKKDIRNLREDFSSIEFTGGEATEHEDILEIVEKASELGFETISLGTNGRNFKDKNFTRKIVKKGVNHVNLSLHGPREIHNEITQKDSFKEVIQGINNILEFDIGLKIVTVLMRTNIDHINELLDLLYNMGIENYGLGDLTPEGRASKNLEELSVDYTYKRRFFTNITEKLGKFENISLVNFPRCIIPKKLYKNATFNSNYIKEKESHFEGGLTNNGKSEEKTKLSQCKECPIHKRCYGFFKEKLRVIGPENARKMIKNSKFVN